MRKFCAIWILLIGSALTASFKSALAQGPQPLINVKYVMNPQGPRDSMDISPIVENELGIGGMIVFSSLNGVAPHPGTMFRKPSYALVYLASDTTKLDSLAFGRSKIDFSKTLSINVPVDNGNRTDNPITVVFRYFRKNGTEITGWKKPLQILSGPTVVVDGDGSGGKGGKSHMSSSKKK